jgi:hypothetical protein
MTLLEYLEKRIAFWCERLRISHAIEADPELEVCALKELAKVKQVMENPDKYTMTCTGQLRKKRSKNTR